MAKVVPNTKTNRMIGNNILISLRMIRSSKFIIKFNKKTGLKGITPLAPVSLLTRLRPSDHLEPESHRFANQGNKKDHLHFSVL